MRPSEQRLLEMLSHPDGEVWRQGAELCQTLEPELPQEVFLAWQARELVEWLPLRLPIQIPRTPPPLRVSTPTQLHHVLLRASAQLPPRRWLGLRSHTCSTAFAEGCFAIMLDSGTSSARLETFLTLRVDAEGLSCILRDPHQ